MKEELVRTDDEKQRYKQLVEMNRQRRREVPTFHKHHTDMDASPMRRVRNHP